MIKLDVEKYCQECVYFQADVESPTKIEGDGVAFYINSDTIIRCSHRNICHSLYKQFKKEEKTND